MSWLNMKKVYKLDSMNSGLHCNNNKKKYKIRFKLSWRQFLKRMQLANMKKLPRLNSCTRKVLKKLRMKRKRIN